MSLHAYEFNMEVHMLFCVGGSPSEIIVGIKKMIEESTNDPDQVSTLEKNRSN